MNVVSDSPTLYRDRVDCCFSLGRVLLLRVTEACNQSCVHCMRSASLMRAEPLDLGVLERALEAWMPRLRPDRVVISGGEPTLVPNLAELVAMLRRVGVRSSLCTNALRVDAVLAQRLTSAGLRSATVGLEGLDDEYTWFRGSSGYGRAIRGIGAMVAAGIRVTVNITLHDRILDAAGAFARRLSALELDSVSVTSPIAQGRAASSTELYGRVTEHRIAMFANRLVQQLECPVSVRVPRCNTTSCPSGRSVFAMDRGGVVSGCPDIGAINVCDRSQAGAAT
jgi:MoaA/NifB/PqqE/SkfB family radical SAM enzyme